MVPWAAPPLLDQWGEVGVTLALAGLLSLCIALGMLSGAYRRRE